MEKMYILIHKYKEDGYDRNSIVCVCGDVKKIHHFLMDWDNESSLSFGQVNNSCFSVLECDFGLEDIKVCPNCCGSPMVRAKMGKNGVLYEVFCPDCGFGAGSYSSINGAIRIWNSVVEDFIRRENEKEKENSGDLS